MDSIKDLIYGVRGKQVMLDSDVAALYNYDTKRINEAVKRNIKRFPSEFCFELTEIEYRNLISHTKNKYSTSEIAMLSGLLKSDTAIEVSINIMNAFVEMRKFISNNAMVFERLTIIEYKMLEHDKKFDEIFDALENKQEIKQKIFYDGQIYDTYSLLIDMIQTANKSIVIIDNYIDKTILDILSKKKEIVMKHSMIVLLL